MNASQGMSLFVVGSRRFANEKDTDLRYPLNFESFENFGGWPVEFGIPDSEALALRLIRRVGVTRMEPLIRKLPRDEVVIRASAAVRHQIIYASYVYPIFIGKKALPPSVLRINFQTERVLKSRGVSNLPNEYLKISRRWSRFSCILTTTRGSIPAIEKLLQNSNTIVRYAPFFLPGLRGHPALNSESTRPKVGKVRFIFVGRDGARKGIFELLNAFESLPASYLQRIDLTIVSETKIAHALTSAPWLRYIPSARNSEVVDMMKASDVFCMPTTSEAYGIVYVEAMAAGCAIIADDDLPRLEMIRENHCGLCVDPMRVSEISAAIRRFIDDKGFLEDCKRASLEAFHREFHPTVVARRHVEVFSELL